MGLISFGGLGSGLDVNSIIEALVNAEKTPKTLQLDRKEADLTLTLSGLGSLKSALDELRTAALDLSLASNFSLRKVTQSSSDYFSVSAGSTATTGTFDIEVVNLAVGTKSKSKVFTGGATTTFGAGTLTFTAGSKTFDVDILASDDLTAIRTKINAKTDNFGVAVNLLNNVTEGPDTGSILTFGSDETGTANNMTVTYTGDASLADLSTNLTQTQAANNANIKIDGLATTSTTNEFKDFVQDVTITAKKANTATETSSFTVALDTGKVKTMVTSFVDVFNDYVDVIKALGSADEDEPGLLLGDATLRQIDSQLRNLISETVSTAGVEFNSLSAIGISTTREGKLEINTTTLDAAISSNFEKLDDLFSGTLGFATKLRSQIDAYTKSDGIIVSRETSINSQIDRIGDDRLALNYRIEQLQTRLVKQFSTMDTLVAQFNSTSAYLTQQLANLPGFTNSSKK